MVIVVPETDSTVAFVGTAAGVVRSKMRMPGTTQAGTADANDRTALPALVGALVAKVPAT
jgi:hypothetical protein